VGQTYRQTPWRYNEEKDRYEVQVSLGGGEYKWYKAVLVHCLNCDKPVARRAAALNKRGNAGRFCSFECYLAFRDRRFENLHRTPRWCVECGARFMAQKNAAHLFATCSNPECRRKHKIKIAQKNGAKTRFKRKEAHEERRRGV